MRNDRDVCKASSLAAWTSAVGVLWRPVVAVIGMQAAGGVLGVALDLGSSVFVSVWLGAALAMPIGFVLGLAWLILSRPRPQPKVVPLLLVIGATAFFVGGTAWLVELPRDIRGRHLVETLRTLDPAGVSDITLSEEHGRSLLMKIEGKEPVVEFLDACQDIQAFSPNHPVYMQSWHVRISGRTPMELVLSCDTEHSDRIVGCFVRTSYGAHSYSRSYHGTFRSNALAAWIGRMRLGATVEPGPMPDGAGMGGEAEAVRDGAE